MQSAKQQRSAPSPRCADRRQKQKYFTHPKHNTTQNNFKSKSHWSRRPEQRKRDAAILASLGLELQQFGNTSFSSFCRKGA